jgi:hypothetical protein
MHLRTHYGTLALLFLGLAVPSVANACSLCVDAASRVTLPGLAEGQGHCPEAVLSLQKLCAFPEGAKMDASLSCAGRARD